MKLQPPSFEAKYPGECPGCLQQLQGYQVCYTDDGALVHLECYPSYVVALTERDPATIGRNERSCSLCFQIHAGECP